MQSQTFLRLFVDPAWNRHAIHAPLLNPWWGNPIVPESVFARQIYDTYSFDTKLYTITDDLQTAHVVFAPYKHNWLLQHDRALLDECVRAARTANRPLLIDGSGDIEHPLALDNAYILRIGGYRFLPEKGRIQIPPIADDLLERCRQGKLTLRPKTEGKPSVGFAGWADLSTTQRLKTILKETPVRLRGLIDSRYRACTKGVLWREKAIRILKGSSKVIPHIRARSTFSASQRTAVGSMTILREEMVETILGSDYALDVRGDANESTRLYEILSLGRIPVIVDTERNFPFSDKVDYSSFALIVDFRDIEHLPERIAEFHASVTKETFEQMQKNAREAYLRYFRIDALTRSIIQALQEKGVIT